MCIKFFHELHTALNVALVQFGVVRDDLLDSHARFEPAYDVIGRDAQTTYARLVAPLACLDGDGFVEFNVIHNFVRKYQ
jgi:hypothetical protein